MNWNPFRRGDTSLRVRLLLAAIVAIMTALSLSGLFLTLLFERHVLRAVDRELTVYIKQLVAGLEVGAGGETKLRETMIEPRFRQPLSGLYWQIETEGGAVLRSRSLWDQSLSLPKFDPRHRGPLRHEITGPDGEQLIVLTRNVFLETPSGDKPIRLIAALDKQEVNDASAAFTRELAVALGLLGAALLLAAWLQIYVGLRPLKQIRRHINNIRNGSATRLEGTYPGEVQSLVGEVNALLSAHESAVARARDSAADLAHGLKTPLAVLQAESRVLAGRQETESAREIAAQVEQMRLRVERHLAVVRLRGPGGGKAGRTDLRQGFNSIVKAMLVMPRAEDIDWVVDVPDDLQIAMDSQDFMEVFGNLLDNARKWATKEIAIRVDIHDDELVLIICDDGPGVPKPKICEIMQRGGRLDEQRTGAGLGLSIAKKLLAAYNGDLRLQNRKEGGLRVLVTVPNAR